MVVTPDDIRRTKLDGQVMFLDGRGFYEQRRGCKAHPVLVRVDRGPRGRGKETPRRFFLVDGQEIEGTAEAIAAALTEHYATGGDDGAFRDWQMGAAHEP